MSRPAPKDSEIASAAMTTVIETTNACRHEDPVLAVDKLMDQMDRYGERGLYAACVGLCDVLHKMWTGGNDPNNPDHEHGVWTLEIANPDGTVIDPMTSPDPAMAHAARFLVAVANRDPDQARALWDAKKDDGPFMGEFVAALVQMHLVVTRGYFEHNPA